MAAIKSGHNLVEIEKLILSAWHAAMHAQDSDSGHHHHHHH